MIITGFVRTNSFKKRELSSLTQCYSRKSVVSSLLRLTVPFAIALLVEEILVAVTYTQSAQVVTVVAFLQEAVHNFFVGGVGPGSYYYPVMMQLIFIFPIVYLTIAHYGKQGLYGVIIFNAVFELLRYEYELNLECYRLLIFRYLSLVAVGIYLNLFDVKKNDFVLLGFASVSIIYRLLLRFDLYSPKILSFWSGSDFLATFFLMPIFYVLLKKINLKCKFLEAVGQASYNVFLVQMVYYTYCTGLVKSFITNECILFIFTLFFCVIAGYIFYLVESRITAGIKRRLIS